VEAEIEKRSHCVVVDKRRRKISRHMRTGFGTGFARLIPASALASDPPGAAGCLSLRLREGRKNVADEKPDIARLVDEAAKAIGLTIAPEYRANVLVNYERSLAIARPLLEVELDDELTPAPVFRP
jgi:hypothetical protein